MTMNLIIIDERFYQIDPSNQTEFLTAKLTNQA